MEGMDAGAETSARLARRVHVVTRQPPALLAPGAVTAGPCVSGWSPTCSSWEGVLGNPVPLSILVAQFKAPRTA